MKTLSKKLIAGMLISVIFTVFAGCGKDTENHSGDDHSAQENQKSKEDHTGHNH